jgi:Flp pilus assembly protein TadD
MKNRYLAPCKKAKLAGSIIGAVVARINIIGARNLRIYLSLFIFAASIILYSPVLNHGFLNYDDDRYVTANEWIRSGITLENVKRAFDLKEVDSKNRIPLWHPLTLISHMIDCELFGLNASMHHFVNVLFHALNSALLYFVISAMTGSVWRSAIVAFLFALHPINVESVAWVAERKNLLSTFFGMLTLMAYVYYVYRRTISWYLATFFFFALGLLAKPYIITFPFLLLLLDFWPLKRTRTGRDDKGLLSKEETVRPASQPMSIPYLILEKIPFFTLSVAYLVIVFVFRVQDITPTWMVPFNFRLSNAIVSYVQYVYKLAWPSDFAVPYPFPSAIPDGYILWSLLFLFAISVATVSARRKRPYLFVGWFWFLGTLIPVTGLIQNGIWPAMADRYAYIPEIGIFIVIVWGLSELTSKRPFLRTIACLAIVPILMILGIITHVQTGYWKDNKTLFAHAATVTKDNDIANYNLGRALVAEGKYSESIHYFSEVIRVRPENADAHNNLGMSLLLTRNVDEAIKHFRKSLALQPGDAIVSRNIARALQVKGNLAEAYFYFGNAAFFEGRIDAAVEAYSNSLAINPDFADLHNNLGCAVIRQMKLEEAIVHFKRALVIRSDHRDAQRNLKKALEMKASQGT